MVETGGSLTRKPKRSLRCLLFEYRTLMNKQAPKQGRRQKNFLEGGGQRKKDRKIAKNNRRIALSLYLLHLYHV